MLFTAMPYWANVVFFMICFAVKHCASERIEKMEFFRMSKLRDWVGSVVSISVFNGFLTFGIFFLFVGWWSLLPAIIDAACQGTTGVYKKKRQLSCCWRKPPLFSEINAMRAIHVCSYVNMILIVMMILHSCSF